MGTPAKRRKLNDSAKASPTPVRNLDFFFGKQNNNNLAQSATEKDNPVDRPLTDEEFARKLQAEWDQEDVGTKLYRHGSASNTALSPKQETSLEQTAGSTSVEAQAGEAACSVNTNEAPVAEAPNTLTEKVPNKSATLITTNSKVKHTLSLQSGASSEDTITTNIPFDQSPLIFEPSKYVADLQSHWAAEGGNASYALLTRCFVLVNSTQSRIKIVDTLVNLLRVLIEGDPSSLLPTVRYV